MSLNDIIQAAQGGQAINNLASQFGLTPEQTQAAVQAMMPAFSMGLQRPRADPNGLGGRPRPAHQRSSSGRLHRSQSDPRGRGERRRRARADFRLAAGCPPDRQQARAGLRRRPGDRPADDAGRRLDADGRPRPFHDAQGFGGVARTTAGCRRPAGRYVRARPGRRGLLGGVLGMLGGLLGGQSGQGQSALAQAGLSALTNMLEAGVPARK